MLLFKHESHAYAKKFGSLTERDFQAYRAVLRRFGEAPDDKDKERCDKKSGFIFRVHDERGFLTALEEEGIPFTRWEPEHGLDPEPFEAMLLLRCHAQNHPTGVLVEVKQEFLALEFKRTERTLRTHVKALEDAGLLRREKNGQRIRLFPNGDAPPLQRKERIPRSGTSGSSDPVQADPQIRPRSSSADLSQDLFRTREASGPASTTAATAPAAPGSSPTPAASSAEATDLNPGRASTTAAGTRSSPTLAASASSASDPLPVGADFAAPGQRSTPAPAAPSVDASAVTQELCYIPDADPGPSARGRRKRPTRQGPEIAAADLPQLLWPGIRAKLIAEKQFAARMLFDLLQLVSVRAGGSRAGGVLVVTAAPDEQSKLERNSTLARAVLIAAAQLTGGAWSLQWVSMPATMDSTTPAEVAHAS